MTRSKAGNVGWGTVRIRLESILRILNVYPVGYGKPHMVTKWGVIYMLYVSEI